MSSHLKPLYVGAHFDGVPVSKVLVDTGATVIILPASIMRKLKKGSDELILTKTMVNGFVLDHGLDLVENISIHIIGLIQPSIEK